MQSMMLLHSNEGIETQRRFRSETETARFIIVWRLSCATRSSHAKVVEFFFLERCFIVSILFESIIKSDASLAPDVEKDMGNGGRVLVDDVRAACIAQKAVDLPVVIKPFLD